jgi:hypothetical protein
MVEPNYALQWLTVLKKVYEIGIILTRRSIRLRRLTVDFTITNVAASFVLRIMTGMMNGKYLLIFCDLQTKQSRCPHWHSKPRVWQVSNRTKISPTLLVGK